MPPSTHKDKKRTHRRRILNFIQIFLQSTPTNVHFFVAVFVLHDQRLLFYAAFNLSHPAQQLLNCKFLMMLTLKFPKIMYKVLVNTTPNGTLGFSTMDSVTNVKPFWHPWPAPLLIFFLYQL